MAHLSIKRRLSKLEEAIPVQSCPECAQGFQIRIVKESASIPKSRERCRTCGGEYRGLVQYVVGIDADLVLGRRLVGD